MIIVCPLHAVHHQAEHHGVGRAISLLGGAHEHPSYDNLDSSKHLKLTFNDISEAMDGFTAPSPVHVEQIIAFVNDWDRDRPMLINCWAGISRSTATAFITQCVLRPGTAEDALAGELRQRSSVATPNRLMVQHADDILGRGGRMTAAIEAIGRGEMAYEGNIFTWQIE